MNDINHKHEFDGKQDRNFHQKPFDEVTDPLPQIDEASANMSENSSQKNGEGNAKTESGRKSEVDDQDERDESNSTNDWDAENNRSGRRK